jgi:hypothetical protein
MTSTASFQKQKEVSLRKSIGLKLFQVVDERWDLEESEEIEVEKRQITEARAQSAALDRQIEAAELAEKQVEEKILLGSKEIGETLNQLVEKLTHIKAKEAERLKELQAQIHL